MLLVLALLVWPVQIQLSINHIVMTARNCDCVVNFLIDTQFKPQLEVL